MKKSVIFYLTYEGKSNKGNRSVRKDFYFKTKNEIIDCFNKWIDSKIIEVEETIGEPIYISNIKIIGL